MSAAPAERLPLRRMRGTYRIDATLPGRPGSVAEVTGAPRAIFALTELGWSLEVARLTVRHAATWGEAELSTPVGAATVTHTPEGHLLAR